MAREKWKGTIDLDNVDLKRRFRNWVGALRGTYDVEIKPRKPLRSLKQNAWYHAAVVEPFAQFLRDQDYEVCGHDECHELLKEKFLAVEIADPLTGEVIGRSIRSTTDLSKDEFADYCERCRAWLLDFFGIITEDPDPDYAAAGAGAGKGGAR